MLAWVLVGLTLAAGYGWAARLLREHGWLTVLLGSALSVVTLTLLMLGESLLGVALTLPGVALPYFTLMLPGWWRIRLPRPQLPSTRGERYALVLLLILAGAIFFNGVYWPFHRPDTLGIYQPAASAIYQTGALVPLTGADSLYHTYPILIPLSYSYAYLAAGWENESLANAIATLLSLACLPAAYVLGREWREKRVGLLAALLLALTPFYSRWASAGYVDLPMAFFYTLAAIFALRLWRTGDLRDALLAGMLVGAACWTKNAALIGVGLLAAWLLWGMIHRKTSWRAAAASLIACAVVSAPWYVRNVLGAGFLVPATAWTEQAQRTLESALVFASQPQDFGVPGLLILFGVGVALRDALRRDAGTLLLLLWTLPFFAAWWLFVSYDPRFLLLFLPPLCVLASAAVVRLWNRVGVEWKPRVRPALYVLPILLLARILWNSVEYKPEILRNPLMSDAEKRAIVRGE